MHILVTAMIVVAFVFHSQSQGMGGNDSYEEEFMYEDYDVGELPPDPVIVLEPHRSLITRAYGSEKVANDKLWDRLSSHYKDEKCFLDNVWVLDEMKSFFDSGENAAKLNDEEKRQIKEIVDDFIIEEMNQTKPRCKDLFQDLRRSRSHLDCALHPHVVTDHFTKMFPPTQCWEFTRGLWIDLIKAGDISKNCSSLEVYTDLVHVAQIAKGRYTYSLWDTATETSRFKSMAQLTETISTPKHLKYLTGVSCTEQPPPWDCPDIETSVESNVCNPLTMRTVDDVEDLVKRGVSQNALTGLDDMEVVMEILSDLTEVVKNLSRTKLETRAFLTIDTLDSYMEIMDNTIGQSAKPVWDEMSSVESKERLQLVLVNNEEYIGAVSKILFGSKDLVNSTGLEKKSMALELIKISGKSKIEFEFEEAEIETNLSGNETANELSLFAINYKSLAELLQQNNLGVNNHSPSQGNKVFVGKGGIISLSAHGDEGEKSLPVSYKMKFNEINVEGDPSNSITRRICLSCEYLNTATGEWENTGCVVASVDSVGIKCRCNHTTNFAAFMSPVPLDIDMTDAQYQAKQIVSYVGSAISVLALALSLIVFNIVRPTLRNDRLKAHMNLAIALFFVHATQLTVDFAINSDVACLTTAVITHFFLLASFFWMLIEGIFLYLYVVQVFVHSSVEYLRWVYVMGWAIPALIVTLSASIGIPYDVYLDLKPTPCKTSEVLYPPQTASKYERCWLSAKSGMAWSFIGPALLIILINTVILGKVFQVLLKVSGRSRNIRPMKPPVSSSGISKSPVKEATSTFSNRSYGLKETEERKTSEMDRSKQNICKPAIDVDYGSTSAADGHMAHSTGGKRLDEKANDSPSRFDGRIPSQAYRYNRTQAQRPSPNHHDNDSKHFIEDVKAAAKGALILLPILGIPWVCGMWVGNNYALMMVFIIMNSTQGLVIFIVYCLMNGEVRRAMQRQFRMAKIRSQNTRSRIGSTSSIRSLNSRFARSWRTKSTAAEFQK